VVGPAPGLASRDEELREAARDFAARELAPRAADWEEREKLPLDVFRAA
jgi:alkylation response protein AidB-like acyl-CoA dehydrogenase